MSAKPSWLDDENNQRTAANAAVAVAQNPIAQKVARDPKVQSAVKDAAVNAILEDPNTPKWAKDSYSPPAVPGAAEDLEGGKGQSIPPPPESEPFECDPETLAEMKKHHLVLRISYIVAAIIMGAAGGIILTKTPSLGQAFFGLYVMFFTLIICCFEVGLDVRSFWQKLQQQQLSPSLTVPSFSFE